jgi:fructoselysine-6-P-deglycase FrlB-like protein
MSDQRPTQLERAIASQPEELGRLLRTPLPHDTVERLRQAHRIWLVGTGTSLHAAELGAAMLHDAGRAAYAMS